MTNMPSRAVIVSHGQPSDPGPQQQAIIDMAAQVAAADPGIEVVGATLAAPDALAEAVRPGCLIYPMFMAEGFFTGRELPRRLAEIGVEGVRILRPFGVDQGLSELCITKARQAAEALGWQASDTTVLLAAHGSQVSQSSAKGTHAMAALMAPHFAAIVPGFVEQEPFLVEAAKGLDQAVCLPFFALRAEHVTDDLPEALEISGFSGPLLDPIGLAPEAPAMIAATLKREISNLK